MPTIYVTSSEPGAGKTGVAAAIARHYAYQGVPTTLVRFAGAGNAEADAAFYAAQFFAPGSPETPQAPASSIAPAANDITVVEGDPGDAPADAKVVLVSLGQAGEVSDGLTPSALVVTRVSLGEIDNAPTTVGETPVVALPEDHTLAGFSVESMRRLLHAEVLVEGDEVTTTCDHLVIAPIGSDAGQPYFRRFERAAVVARYDKTDMHLAAIRGEPVVLVLTGGRRPSEYTLDAGRAHGLPILLSRTDTENTIIALETLFDDTRFEGEAKVERMAQLLESSVLFDALGLEISLPTGS